MVISDEDLAQIALGHDVPGDVLSQLKSDKGAQKRLAQLMDIHAALDPLGFGDDPPVTLDELTDYELGQLHDRDAVQRVQEFLKDNPEYSIEPEDPKPHFWSRELVTGLICSAVAAALTSGPPAMTYLVSSTAWIDTWTIIQRQAIWLAVAVVLAAVFLGILLRRRRVTDYFVCSALAAVLVGIATFGLAEVQKYHYRAALHAHLLQHRWIGYDSPSFDPETNPSPSEEDLLAELTILHDAGFTGLITFDCYGKNLAELAERAGFDAIIIGISVEPTGEKPQQEMDDVTRYLREMKDPNRVVGICLGHNTPSTLRLSMLASWISELRRTTGKPVTSTFPFVSYLGEAGEEARQIGDWYFPDIHASWHRGTSPQAALRETREAIKDLTDLSRNKPCLLKFVSYPSGPLEDEEYPGLSPANQLAFFEGIVRDVYLPSGMYISVMSGFDLPWKGTRPAEFAAPEEFIGLFTAWETAADGQRIAPRKKVVQRSGRENSAADIIAGDQWPIQNRP